jgi:hypothetical protein
MTTTKKPKTKTVKTGTTPTKLSSQSKILLKESFNLELPKDSLVEGTSSHAFEGKHLILRGVIQRCNTLNQNGRVYPRNVLVPKLEHYIKTKVNTGTAYGGLDHKDSEIVEWRDTAFRFRKIWLEDDVVCGEIVVLPGTDAEKILRGALETGGKVGISSRAMGSVQRQTLPEGMVADVVQDDLQIICWDIVTEPSTPKAFMELGHEHDDREHSDTRIQVNNSFRPRMMMGSMNENKKSTIASSDVAYNDLVSLAKKLAGKK